MILNCIADKDCIICYNYCRSLSGTGKVDDKHHGEEYPNSFFHCKLKNYYAFINSNQLKQFKFNIQI